MIVRACIAPSPIPTCVGPAATANSSTGGRHCQRIGRISTALDEARSEPSFSRFNDVAYSAFLEELSHLNQRLMAMCRDSNLYSHAGVVVALVPELKPLTEMTAEAFEHLSQALRTQSTAVHMGDLDKAERDLDQRLQTLRAARATSPFTLDRMLPFWSFLFNLKEIVGSLRALNEKLKKLS
jgi:hypothetical protein